MYLDKLESYLHSCDNQFGFILFCFFIIPRKGLDIIPRVSAEVFVFSVDR